MSDHLVTAEHFRELFLSDTPFLDVRAEVEFAKGRFPTSKNLPILNDSERQSVGTCYKEKGKQAAIAMGHELVSGKAKDQRINAWCAFAKSQANTHIYCWRGGMRSNYARQWMHEAGVDVPLIDGGFKALRRQLIDEIDDCAAHVPVVRIGGKTGTSKTVLVNEVDFSVDLEGHANHRGSSFGRRVAGSPSQIDFENALAIDLMRKRQNKAGRTLIVEDESRRIGPCALPQDFFDAMNRSDIAVIEMPVEPRVDRILQEYVIEMRQDFIDFDADDAWQQFSTYLTQSLFRVQKRLGLERYQKIATLMDAALHKQRAEGDVSDHRAWIELLLSDYYDPMCEYQLDQQSDQIIFRGSYDEVLGWARDKSCTG